MSDKKPKMAPYIPWAPKPKFNIEVDMTPIPYDTPGYPSTPQPLESLLPTGPIDFAAETILSGIGRNNPKLAILAGLAAPHAAKAAVPVAKAAGRAIDVHGGSMYSKWMLNRVYKKAGLDPDFADIPLSELSEFVDRDVADVRGFAGRYNPVAGRVWYDRAGDSGVSFDPAFQYKPQTLREAWENRTDFFGQGRFLGRESIEDIAWHELEHFKQHGRGWTHPSRGSRGLAGDTYVEPLSGKTVTYATNPSVHGQFATRIDIPKPANKMADWFMESKKAAYLMQPIEIEARIASLARVKNPKKIWQRRQHRQLEDIGYNDAQIATMVDNFKDIKRKSESTLKDMQNFFEGTSVDKLRKAAIDRKGPRGVDANVLRDFKEWILKYPNSAENFQP